MFSTAYDDASAPRKTQLEERIFHSNALSTVNFTLFWIYLIIAIINCSFLFWRFCKGKGVAYNLKNRFVLRHFHLCFHIHDFYVALPTERFSLHFSF